MNAPPRELPSREGPHYPQSPIHTWGAFAGLALELDGYSGVEVIAPWSGKMLYVPDAFRSDGEPEDWATILRRVADGIEAAGWTGG